MVVPRRTHKTICLNTSKNVQHGSNSASFHECTNSDQIIFVTTEIFNELYGVLNANHLHNKLAFLTSLKQISALNQSKKNEGAGRKICFTQFSSQNRVSTMKLFACCMFLFLVGCTSSTPYIQETQQLDRSALPSPDLTVSIPNLSNCTDSTEKSIQLDSKSPITVLVHGCDSSAGHFRSLAQLYAFHGQQAICYSYDDRASLVDSADKLAIAVNELANATNNQNISIIGHSMGGLVARKAVEKNDRQSNILSHKNLELITISAPLSGIRAANHCGIKPLHWLSVGIIPGICWLITGDNWNEITSSSSFIQEPEPLLPSVHKYLKIVTNEKNTCRQKDSDGRCIESDYVFSLPEQYHPTIDSYKNITSVQVDAGHVEIVGNKRVIPRKLLSILQEYDMLSYTPEDRKEAFERLLADLY